MDSSTRIRLRLLGSFDIVVGDQPVPERGWRSQRAADLVKLLALSPGYRLHREQIMEALWPDLDPANQANNLNVAASRARQALASAGAPPGAFVVRRGDHLALGPNETIWTDVADFHARAARARVSSDSDLIEQALEFYRGDLLPEDRYAEWASHRREELHAEAVSLLATLGDVYTSQGKTDRAIETYQRLLSLEPADEATIVALMRLYAGRGQRSRALSLYVQLVRRLRNDLDVDPLPETMALAASIRDGKTGGHRGTGDADAASGPTSLQAVQALPAQLSPLIGREGEIEQVSQVLERERLITLTGPGGIGKTRLAVAVAERVRDRFRDGVVFVDLSFIRDPDLVGPALAQGIDVRLASGQDVSSALVTALAPRNLLLVLDNFEQVAGAAPLIAHLLQRARTLSVLVTSRMGLRLSGEREFPVPPLKVPTDLPSMTALEAGAVPALSLFLDRARRIRPDFRMTPDQAEAIAEICRRVDGLPLAIELAAARVKVLTPAAMLTRLERPLAFLVGDAADRPARHQTVRRMIAWSHDLLSQPEQRLLRRLSVFWGGWTLDAAEQVVGAADDSGIELLGGLASLVDKSLLVQREDAEGIRFSMLETLRDFAQQELAAHNEIRLFRERHLAWTLDLAERAACYLESSEQVIWLDRIDREAGNVRHALDWAHQTGDVERGARLAVALTMYWFIRGQLPEGVRQLLSIADAPASHTFPGLRAELLNRAALMCRDGDAALAQRISEESRDISRHAGDAKREADALANLAYIALEQGRLDDAHFLASECLTINQQSGNQQGIADVTSVLALVAASRGEFDDARQLHMRSLAIWESLKDMQGVVWARTRLSTVLVQTGDVTGAFDLLESSYRAAQLLDFRWGFSWTLDGCARLAVALEAPELAAASARLAASVRSISGLVLPSGEQAEVDAVWRAIDRSTGDQRSVSRSGVDGTTLTADEVIGALRQHARASVKKNAPSLS